MEKEVKGICRNCPEVQSPYLRSSEFRAEFRVSGTPSSGVPVPEFRRSSGDAILNYSEVTSALSDFSSHIRLFVSYITLEVETP